MDKSTKITKKQFDETKEAKAASKTKQNEHIIDKLVREVRKRDQQPMLEIKWLGCKITTKEPVGNIKADQPIMVEQFYKNKYWL